MTEIEEKAEKLANMMRDFLRGLVKEYDESSIGYAMCGAGMAAIQNAQGVRGLRHLRELLDNTIEMEIRLESLTATTKDTVQ